MAEEQRLQPLDYRGPLPGTTRAIYIESPEERGWRHRRVLFRIAMNLLFVPVAFYFGPNVFKFGKLTGLTGADFVTEAQQNAVPVVQAIKAY
jgi:hypothetical protein